MKRALRMILLTPVALILGIVLLPALIAVDLPMFTQFIDSILSGNHRS
ncbi:hypothetical protein J26TS2_42660 [Shouchella clausii]|nr:hypothetical protein [Shouchella tritolerans]GIN14399.1 hypothetical protein J26TS2_42660 [Shouchella clausii]